VSGERLSAFVVARNEAHQLADCLATLRFADELIVLLDRTTDQSRTIAEQHGALVIEGSWPIEGERRAAAASACTGDWLLEIDADERVPAALAAEIRSAIADAAPGYFLIPFDNYIGSHLVRYGWGASFGVMAAARLFTPGAKRWGSEHIHPSVTLSGPKRRLHTPINHLVDRDFADMVARLKRYSAARAADLRASGRPLPSLLWTLRRSASRFLKCYVARQGYREGRWGFAIALMAALFPLLARLQAELDGAPPPDQRD
jgi:glycosyltransferase involved in cell wall biosynthesis